MSEVELNCLDAQRLYVGLTLIDGDPSTKFSTETRFALAINTSRLFPIVRAYETALAKAEAALPPGLPHAERAKQLAKDAMSLAERREKVSLQFIRKEHLRLDDNPAIKGQHVAMIAPIIEDFDAGSARSPVT